MSYVHDTSAKTNIYCGNNAAMLHTRDTRLGTPYECMRRGIGVGLRTNIPSDFTNVYVPITPNTTHCGSINTLPAGKRMGTPAECLRKGVGVGMKRQYMLKLANTIVIDDDDDDDDDTLMYTLVQVNWF